MVLWAPNGLKRRVLSLAVVAWTLGLRHALDMDHIVAIDNVTRNLVAMGQRPVTVGLFFSLGHSSIVIGVTIAIIIATSNIDKIPGVANIGGVIGVSISASFLLLLAVINSISLYQTLRNQRKLHRKAETALSEVTLEQTKEELAQKEHEDIEALTGVSSKKSRPSQGLPATTCLARIGKPVFKLIDSPWKMYPVGLLFGFGFDTSSEIALLGVAALARSSSLPAAQIILLPLLFTAGMVFVDSCDSVLMLSAYALPEITRGKGWKGWQLLEKPDSRDGKTEDEDEEKLPEWEEKSLLRMMVGLTLVSIVMALLISIVEFMGLALAKCTSCSDAADSHQGLSGNWWRFWQKLNDNSGYLGIGVVGVFLVILAVWLTYTKIKKMNRAVECEVAGYEGAVS